MMQGMATGRTDAGNSVIANALTAGHATTEALVASGGTMPTGEGRLHLNAQEAESQGTDTEETATGSTAAKQEGREDIAAGAQQPFTAASAESTNHAAPVIEWWQEGQDGTVAVAGDAQCAPSADWMDYYRGEAAARCIAQLAASAKRNSAAKAAGAAPQVEDWAGHRADAAIANVQAGATGRAQQRQWQQRDRGPGGAATSAQQLGGPFQNGTPGNSIPKESIRKARFRQELERRAAEEAALLSYRFRANPVPPTSSQPRRYVLRLLGMRCDGHVPMLLHGFAC